MRQGFFQFFYSYFRAVTYFGVGWGFSIASTVSTWQNVGTSKPGYQPITTFDAYIPTVSTIVSIGTPYPVPVFANLYIFVYDMQRANPVPVK